MCPEHHKKEEKGEGWGMGGGEEGVGVERGGGIGVKKLLQMM